MGKKTVLGHIDCPVCGTAGGMSITHDRNGDPYGYCEANCDAQLRIGGKARRVAAFIARYPWAAGQVTDVPPGEDEDDEAPPPKTPEAKPAPTAPPKGRHWLEGLGVRP